MIVFHIGRLKERRRADQNDRAGASHAQKVGHALEREDRNRPEAGEQQIPVFAKLRVGKVEAVVEEPGGRRPEGRIPADTYLGRPPPP